MASFELAAGGRRSKTRAGKTTSAPVLPPSSCPTCPFEHKWATSAHKKKRRMTLLPSFKPNHPEASTEDPFIPYKQKCSEILRPSFAPLFNDANLWSIFEIGSNLAIKYEGRYNMRNEDDRWQLFWEEYELCKAEFSSCEDKFECLRMAVRRGNVLQVILLFIAGYRKYITADECNILMEDAMSIDNKDIQFVLNTERLALVKSFTNEVTAEVLIHDAISQKRRGLEAFDLGGETYIMS